MKTFNSIIGIASLCGTAALMGCGPDVVDTDAVYGNDRPTKIVSNKITGSVQEWSVNVSATHAEAGEVKFAITNFGTMQHEFLVVKTDLPVGEIPIGEDNRFSEEAEGLVVVDEIAEWDVDESNLLVVDLEPGKYQLLCNIEGHYANGMHAAFEVID